MKCCSSWPAHARMAYSTAVLFMAGRAPGMASRQDKPGCWVCSELIPAVTEHFGTGFQFCMYFKSNHYLIFHERSSPYNGIGGHRILSSIAAMRKINLLSPGTLFLVSAFPPFVRWYSPHAAGASPKTVCPPTGSQWANPCGRRRAQPGRKASQICPYGIDISQIHL